MQKVNIKVLDHFFNYLIFKELFTKQEILKSELEWNKQVNNSINIFNQ